MKVLRKNKYELYVSLVVAFVGFMLTAHLPHDYKDALVASCALLISLLCSVNALLDQKRMNSIERIIAVPWFVLLLFLTPFTIWQVAHITMFADR